MITSLMTRKTLVFAGLFALAVLTLVFPTDAFAQIVGVTNDVSKQAKIVGQQATNIPKLIAIGSYVIGAAFAVRALFALKGYIEEPDDNPPTKVLAFSIVSALMILLPYIIGVMATSLGSQNATVDSSAMKFQDVGASANWAP